MIIMISSLFKFCLEMMYREINSFLLVCLLVSLLFFVCSCLFVCYLLATFFVCLFVCLFLLHGFSFKFASTIY